MSSDPQSPETVSAPSTETVASLGRRRFLSRAGAGAAAPATVSATAGMAIPALAGEADEAGTARESAAAAANRVKKSYQYRMSAAKMARRRPLVAHVNNGDDERYASKAGSYSKGLPHDERG